MATPIAALESRGNAMTQKFDTRDTVVQAVSRLPEAATLEDIRDEFEAIAGPVDHELDAPTKDTSSFEVLQQLDARNSIVRCLSHLPADASLEDVREEFETIYGILDGTRDSLAGRWFTHDEVMEEARQWMRKSGGQAEPVESLSRSSAI